MSDKINTNTYNTVSPIDLLTPLRFDITAKLIFGEFYKNKYNSNWGREVYKSHLKVWNNFWEASPPRNSYEDFENNFINILKSIQNEGFNSHYAVPVDNKNRLVNGSHRVSSCILTNTPICTRLSKTPQAEGTPNCSYIYLKNKRDNIATGLEEKYLDSMAYTYCRNKPNTFIITIYPAANGDMIKTEDIINNNSKVVYKKQFSLNKKGAIAYTRTAYQGESWGGNWSNRFAGFFNKARQCFPTNKPTVVYLVESTLDKLTQIKKEVREIHKISNHSIHINDTHEETLRLAQFAFNTNSIHFANNATPTLYPRFQEMLDDYSNILKNENNFCITGSAVMSMYGLRSARDIDYFHNSTEPLITTNNNISSHNKEINHYTTSIDDVIYNPQNHFWFNGIKFASLDIIRLHKEKRAEVPKDIDDLKLIHNVLKT